MTEQLSIFSRGDSPVRTYHPMEKPRGYVGRALVYMPNFLKLLAMWDRNTLSWKMSQTYLGGGAGEWFGKLLYDLAKSGYNAEWESISAASLGFEHERDRCFVVAYPTSIRWSSAQFHNIVTYEHKRISGKYSSPSYKEIRRISKADATTEINGIPNIMGQLKGYGNAIVPQVVVPIMQAIKQIEQGEP